MFSFPNKSSNSFQEQFQSFLLKEVLLAGGIVPFCELHFYYKRQTIRLHLTNSGPSF